MSRKVGLFLCLPAFVVVVLLCVTFTWNARYPFSSNLHPRRSEHRLRTNAHPLQRHCPLVPAIHRARQDLNCTAWFLSEKNALSEQKRKTQEAKRTNSTAKLNDANRNYTSSTANLDIAAFLKNATETSDYCETLWYDRCYVNEPLTDEEASFPIAYSILIYKDVAQFERLLRAIYRPQNYYCVHVDKKSDSAVRAAAGAIASCFHNVFLSSVSINVVWGTFAVLEAELVCMRDLLAYRTWKYFINLTGQEFPLKTNLALVRILKAFNGSNHIDGTVKGRNKERYRKAPPLKVNVTVTKGSVHIVATRAFVAYAMESQPAREFLAWVNHTLVPDETFFASLNHSPQLGVPGAYTGVPEMGQGSYQFISRYKVWVGDTCSGKISNSLCIFGVGDLERLGKSKALFANKFHANYQPEAYECMEEWIFNRSLNDLEKGADVIDTAFYSQLAHVKNHVSFD